MKYREMVGRIIAAKESDAPGPDIRSVDPAAADALNDFYEQASSEALSDLVRDVCRGRAFCPVCSNERWCA